MAPTCVYITLIESKPKRSSYIEMREIAYANSSTESMAPNTLRAYKQMGIDARK